MPEPMNRLRDAKVGDTLVLVLTANQYREPDRNVRRAKVVKSGPKLVHVASEYDDVRLMKFRKDDGSEVDDHVSWHAYTEDEWADVQRRQALRERLNNLGCTIKSGNDYTGWRYSADTLEAVAVLLEGETS